MHISKSLLLCALVSIAIHAMENVDPQRLREISAQQAELIKQQERDIECLKKDKACLAEQVAQLKQEKQQIYAAARAQLINELYEDQQKALFFK